MRGPAAPCGFKPKPQGVLGKHLGGDPIFILWQEVMAWMDRGQTLATSVPK